MDPNVWGPLLWGVMNDVVKQYDYGSQPPSARAVETFFKSVAFLLPCKYCRRSYALYLSALPLRDPLRTRTLTCWIWRLHEKVNDKLGKRDRVTLKNFQRRLCATTYSAGPHQLFDFLFMLGVNYDPRAALKRKYMLKFHSVLPFVLPYPLAGRSLEFGKITDRDLESKHAYFEWLYSKKRSFAAKMKLTDTVLPLETYVQRAEWACAGK